MNLLTTYMTNEMNLSSKEQKLIIFQLKCLLYDLSKFIVMFLFFYFTGNLDKYLFAVMVSIPLRTQSGGLHFKHYWSCFLFSFGYFSVIICFLSSIILPRSFFLMLMALCSVTNYFLSPVLSPSRPPLSAEEIQSVKQRAFIITICCALVILLLYHTPFASAVCWTIILHSLQLLIAYIIQKRRKKHEKQ